jgi:predicted transcriptional regulator
MERIFCNDQLIKEVATELGLTVETVRNMVAVQSEYTRVVMESNTFDGVRWPYLGCFKSKPKEIQMLQYLEGMTPEQAAQFKKDVRTGRIKLNAWEDKLKQQKKKNNGGTKTA